MEIIFETSAGTSYLQQGLSRYNLLQSADLNVKEEYKSSLDLSHGALSYNADNDTTTKFRIAIARLILTDSQRSTLSSIRNEIVNIERTIDPARLSFEIGITPDDEIYISRKSSYGMNNMLIYEDGTISHSFIGFRESGKQDYLDFLEPFESIDFEHLLFNFFSYR